MHAADAIEHAKAALHEADRQARIASAEVSAALVAVADGWTRLAAALAEHPIAAVTEVHVHNPSPGLAPAERMTHGLGTGALGRRA